MAENRSNIGQIRHNMPKNDMKNNTHFMTKPLFATPSPATALAMNCGKLKAKNSQFF
jgi:hypothetical protein